MEVFKGLIINIYDLCNQGEMSGHLRHEKILGVFNVTNRTFSERGRWGNSRASHSQVSSTGGEQFGSFPELRSHSVPLWPSLGALSINRYIITPRAAFWYWFVGTRMDWFCLKRAGQTLISYWSCWLNITSICIIFGLISVLRLYTGTLGAKGRQVSSRWRDSVCMWLTLIQKNLTGEM